MAMAALVLGVIGRAAVLALLSPWPSFPTAIWRPTSRGRRGCRRATGSFAEYAIEKRIFVPIEAIPRQVIEAFLAAEDKNFYAHSGVDWLAMSRAAMLNVVHLGDRSVGGSTIT
jgi:membrane peptidoglycan carboxypeptidase